MGLKHLINNPIEDREDIIEYAGQKFLVRGSADANIFTSIIMMSPTDIMKEARHFTRVIGREVSADIIKHIHIVHVTLQPAMWDAENSTWVDEDPYDITDIAQLAVKHGGLFLNLMAAGYSVLGLAVDPANPENVNAFDEIAAKNSETPA